MKNVNSNVQKFDFAGTPQLYDSEVLLVPPPFMLPLKNCLGEVKECQLLSIDYLIVPEIKWLWTQGITTIGCCSGHGDPTTAFIQVSPNCVGQMLELGYEFYNEEVWAFNPKSILE